MAMYRAALARVLLIVAISGCGPDELRATPDRATGTPPRVARTEAADSASTNGTPRSLGETRGPTDQRPVERINQAPVLVGIVVEPFGEVTVRNDIVAKPQASDFDNDEIKFRYTWRVNGARSFVVGNTLPRSEFSRGDWIGLNVVASDGLLMEAGGTPDWARWPQGELVASG